jgi:HEAT repeat protein
MSEQEFQDLIYDLYYPDAARREAAKGRYAALGREERVTQLKKVLHSDMDGLVWRAIALLLQDDRELHLPLILPLFDSKFPGVRYVTCAVFGDGAVGGALPQLERLAQTDPNGRVRYTAIRALGKCGNVDTINVLEQLLDFDDDDGEGRRLPKAAEEAIGEIKGRFGTK